MSSGEKEANVHEKEANVHEKEANVHEAGKKAGNLYAAGYTALGKTGSAGSVG